MFNPFQPVQPVRAEVVSSMPAEFRRRRSSEWIDINRHGEPLDCFIEGPSFDREGNLWLVDIPFGRIFRITPEGSWTLVCEYDGWPNGLKIHRDGRVFIADHRKGLLVLDPATGELSTVLGSAHGDPFKGLNDLHFAANGDLYFTDQGQSGIADRTGRVFRLRADGSLERLCGGVPSPNGITLNASERHCYVAVTRAQQIWRMPMLRDGTVAKAGVAIQLSGGIAGPDGIEMDAEDGLVVCHLGVGVWRFDANMLPTHLIAPPAPRHRHMANIAFGGAGRRDLYIVDSMSGDVLKAQLGVAGPAMFAHT
jgi:gluconolactonase